MFLPSNITLKFGDTGDFVAELQRRLVMVQCFTGDAVNGFYDGNTVNGVSRFQGMNGLNTDGVAGPETLRRLNGVIAGDASGAPADSKPEEAVQQQSDAASMQMLMDQPPPDPFYSPQEEAPALEVSAPLPASDVTPPSAPTQEAIAPQAPSDILAAMMLADNQPLVPAPLAPPAADPAPLMEAVQPPNHAGEVPVTVQTPLPAQTAEIEPASAADEPQGVLGMAKRFTSAVIEKLAHYFETKLPPSVLKEVQQIGVTMVANGMREAPMPQGPEIAPLRDQQIPGRSGDDQQIQRG